MWLDDLGQFLNVHEQFLEKIFMKVMWDKWNDAGTVAFLCWEAKNRRKPMEFPMRVILCFQTSLRIRRIRRADRLNCYQVRTFPMPEETQNQNFVVKFRANRHWLDWGLRVLEGHEMGLYDRFDVDCIEKTWQTDTEMIWDLS